MITRGTSSTGCYALLSAVVLRNGAERARKRIIEQFERKRMQLEQPRKEAPPIRPATTTVTLTLQPQLAPFAGTLAPRGLAEADAVDMQPLAPSIQPAVAPVRDFPVQLSLDLAAAPAAGAADRPSVEPRRVEELVEQVKSSREGAFASIWRQPAFQALLLPFGGYGSVELVGFVVKAMNI